MNRSAPFMGVVFLIALWGFAGFPTTLQARPTLPRIPGSPPPTVLYFEPLTLLAIKPQRSPQYPDGEDRTTVSFVAFARYFDLELEPNDIFAPGAETLWIDNGTVRKEAPPRIFYKGRVTGEPGSWVRVSMHNGLLDGMIRTKDELYFLEPGKRFFAGSSPYEMVIYRLSDTFSDWEPGSCALEDPTVRSELERQGTITDDGLLAEYQALVTELQQTVGSEALAGSSGTFEQLELGIVADYEYYQRHGANAAIRMQNIINQVDGVYRDEVGVTLKITATVVFSTANDPFSDTTDPTKLLPEFSAYKNTSSSPIYQTGLAHLFTGRDLDGNTIGIAWLNTLCEKYYGTGLSQDLTSSNKSRVLLTAHELGHNFSADHDTQRGSPCASAPPGFIMSPVLSSDLQLKFSDCSKGFIQTAATAATCITTVFHGFTTQIGVFRPSANRWYLDANGNGQWDGCMVDDCLGPFGLGTDLPVAGDWDGTGMTKIGVFRSGNWYLDFNGSGQWEGSAGGDRAFAFGLVNDRPVVGDWTGGGETKIGVFRPSTTQWYVDRNGNGQWDGCTTDGCLGPFGLGTDLPVAGDWNGMGIAQIGVFRNGSWYLDLNGNGRWDGCGVDRCYSFGLSSDRPVVGDWNGSGTTKVGVYRNGSWYLDLNGNGKWDGCGVDRCYYSFGLNDDLPVGGTW